MPAGSRQKDADPDRRRHRERKSPNSRQSSTRRPQRPIIPAFRRAKWREATTGRHSSGTVYSAQLT
jgi:hypothetical protein